jgi:hypothetical protein
MPVRGSGAKVPPAVICSSSFFSTSGTTSGS